MAAAYSLSVGNESVATITISMGSAVAAMGIVRALKERKGEMLYDERTVHINRIVMSYTMTVIYLLIAVLILVNYFEIFQMSAIQVLSLLLFTIAGLQIVFRIAVSKKGV
jgi:uncharacterized membrane protein